jgi:DNA-binding SARP family transcriptional activator
LAALLWPEIPQAAYDNLRQALARVRKALPDMPEAQASWRSPRKPYSSNALPPRST